MKEMPILTETMAPLVFRTSSCVRSRDPDTDMVDDGAPQSKRMCSVNMVGVLSQSLLGREDSELGTPEFVESEAVIGPGTPMKEEVDIGEFCRKTNTARWEALELCLLERVTRSLSVADLCSLSQVNKHYQEMCTRDALWGWRAAEVGFCKAVEEENWQWNYKAACTGMLHAVPLDSAVDLHFAGDVAIVDPFQLFFAGRFNSAKQSELRRIVKESHYRDLVLTYRGVQSAVLRTSCAIHDDDSAFDVFRDGQEVGANVTSSGVIAVVPYSLVRMLVEENGSATGEKPAGVTVVGVNGVLRRSLDGDFIIRHPEPSRGKLVLFPFSGDADYADVLCSSGGSWTEESESDDEEEELTEEEMAEAIAEVACITSSFTNARPSPFYCNGDGLLHKFTSFEVSMLS